MNKLFSRSCKLKTVFSAFGLEEHYDVTMIKQWMANSSSWAAQRLLCIPFPLRNFRTEIEFRFLCETWIISRVFLVDTFACRARSSIFSDKIDAKCELESIIHEREKNSWIQSASFVIPRNMCIEFANNHDDCKNGISGRTQHSRTTTIWRVFRLCWGWAQRHVEKQCPEW